MGGLRLPVTDTALVHGPLRTLRCSRLEQTAQVPENDLVDLIHSEWNYSFYASDLGKQYISLRGPFSQH